MKQSSPNNFIIAGFFLLLSLMITSISIAFFSDESNHFIVVGGLIALVTSLTIVSLYFRSELKDLFSKGQVNDIDPSLTTLLLFLSWVALIASTFIISYSQIINLYESHPIILKSIVVGCIIILLAQRITNFNFNAFFLNIKDNKPKSTTLESFPVITKPEIRLSLPKSDKVDFYQAFTIALFCYIRDITGDNVFRKIKESDDLSNFDFYTLWATCETETKFKIHACIIPWCVHHFSFKDNASPLDIVDADRLRKLLQLHYKDRGSIFKDIDSIQLSRIILKNAPKIQDMLSRYSYHISFILSQIKYRQIVSLESIRSASCKELQNDSLESSLTTQMDATPNFNVTKIIS